MILHRVLHQLNKFNMFVQVELSLSILKSSKKFKSLFIYLLPKVVELSGRLIAGSLRVCGFAGTMNGSGRS